MTRIFADGALADFWDDGEYALEKYVNKPASDELIASVDAELGYKLPASFVELMKSHNGGIPHKTCFPTEEPTSWAEDHIAITGIMGIGRKKIYSLCGERGSRFWIEEWRYPDIGVYVCDCPSGGHDMVLLDYRSCGPSDEPQVVHVDQESDYKITFLAPDFESFIRGLLHEDVYDTSEEDLAADLERVKSGRFSSLLTELVAGRSTMDFGVIIRNICLELTRNKGHFSMHGDDLSHLMYDVQFLLYTGPNRVDDKAQYLQIYADMIALGDGEFGTGGYAQGFVEEWLDQRITQQRIVNSPSTGLRFTSEYEDALLSSVRAFEAE